MRTTILTAAALAAGLVAAAPAAASVDPSLSITPKRVALGETATIQGQSWVVGAGCSRNVRVSVTGLTEGERWRAPVGVGQVERRTAGFRLTWTPPQSKFRGVTGRATLIGRQACPDDQGGTMVRRTRITLVD
ncbi:MAG TPA: hypothetical protein VIL49_01370 [Capillimicrobium sp.]|jgi:opacity protein-like surface antigen